MNHEITRIRHEPRRRRLSVARVGPVTPGMLRVHLTGADLADFASLAPDDHIKVLVPGPDEEREPRDYTPRRYDAAAGELAIDFALHEAGPASDWARNARPGDSIEIGGPRGSVVVSPIFDWWVLIGDETALPAIGRTIEELPPGTLVTSIVAVAGSDEEQRFTTSARHRAIWVHRPIDRAADPAPILKRLASLPLEPGAGFVWVAAEAGVARAVRTHFLEVKNHPKQWLKASGYWVKGRADAHEKFES